MYCVSYKSPAAVSRNLCPENPAATKWDPNKISWALEVGFSPNFSKFAKKQKLRLNSMMCTPLGPWFSSVLWFEFCKKITSLAQDQSGSNDTQWNGVTREMKRPVWPVTYTSRNGTETDWVYWKIQNKYITNVMFIVPPWTGISVFLASNCTNLCDCKLPSVLLTGS